MEEYRFIINIEYKGKYFWILSNKKYQKYFLRILDDGALMYPTMEEFVDLYRIFSNTKSQKLFSIQKSSSNKNKTIRSGTRVRIVPRVIKEVSSIVELISLTAAIATTLFILEPDKDPNINQPVISATLAEYQDYSEMIELKIGERTFNYEQLEFLDYSQEDISGKIIEIHNYINDEHNKYVFCMDLEEFKEYLDVKEATFDDVRSAVRENNNIPDRYKEMILLGLDNLEEYDPEFDLAILYYNIKNIKKVIIYDTIEEVDDNADGKNVSGYYDYVKNEVGIWKNARIGTVLHEFIGHGATIAQIDTIKEEKRIRAIYRANIETPLLQNSDEDLENASITSVQIGNSAIEVEANEIEVLLTGRPIERSGYGMETLQFRIAMAMTDVSLNDLIEKRVSFLLDMMYREGIDSADIYISNIDTMCEAERYAESYDNSSIIYNIVNLFEDYFSDKDMKLEEKEKYIIEIFKKCGLEYIVSSDAQNIYIDDICGQVAEIIRQNDNLRFLQENKNIKEGNAIDIQIETER